MAIGTSAARWEKHGLMIPRKIALDIYSDAFHTVFLLFLHELTTSRESLPYFGPTRRWHVKPDDATEARFTVIKDG